MLDINFKHMNKMFKIEALTSMYYVLVIVVSNHQCLHFNNAYATSISIYNHHRHDDEG